MIIATALALSSDTENTPLTIGLVLFVGGIATGVIAIVLWFLGELRKNRALFFRIVSRHNREDDENFGTLSDDIWRVIARNASKDGEPIPQRKSLRRRRYLNDDDGGDEKDG